MYMLNKNIQFFDNKKQNVSYSYINIQLRINFSFMVNVCDFFQMIKDVKESTKSKKETLM